MTKMTAADLQDKTLAQLTELYNSYGIGKPIKMFSGKKEDAIERVLGAHTIATMTPVVQKPVKNPKPAGKKEGKVTAAKKPAAAKKASGGDTSRPKVGSGAYIREELKKGKKTPQEILAAMLERFPTSKATVKDVYWHSYQLRQAGEL